MKALVMALFLSFVAMMHCDARAVQVMEMKALMQESALVFAGKVKSVAPSGMTTELAYPTWKGAVFEWLKVDMEVIEPIKGVKKGAVVKTMMLAEKGERTIMINPPGMVEPQVGKPYLCCLLPIADGEGYASITAPFDDDEGIFLLDRGKWTDDATYYKDGKAVAFREQDEKNAALWNLVDAEGSILAAGAETIRTKYRAEIAMPAPKDAVVHLKWRKETGDEGWEWNVPDAGGKEKKAKPRSGPVSK